MQSTTSVNCAVAKGDPPIEINWMFNGSKLFTSDGILITKSGQKISFLSIESVQARHAGNYTCVAKNRAGFAEHTSELKVMGNAYFILQVIISSVLFISSPKFLPFCFRSILEKNR